MRRASLRSIVSALILAISGTATAAPKAFTGTLTIRLGLGFNSDTPGSGTGTSDGGFGSPATIGSGVFPVHTTFAGSPPFLGILTAVEIAAPGSPGVPGGNGPLNWNGSTGTMPLDASAFLKGFGTTLGSIPLNVVGAGGTQSFQLGTLPGSVVGNLYQLGYFFLTGVFDGSFLAVSAVGFDNRTANGFGQLQMVSPTFINFSGFGTIPAAAIVSLNFLPPPPTNDDFADATPVTDLPYSETTTTNGATRETNEPFATCGFGSTTGTLWWAFTPSETQTVSARASAQFFSTYTAVYTGTSLSNLSQIACENFSDLTSFVAEVGQTYFLQVGSVFGDSGTLQFQIDVAPPPTASFGFFPSDASKFDLVQFFDNSFDPADIGIETQSWDFGDGASDTGCCPEHRYAQDGEYTVVLTVTTFDGRSASTSLVVSIETHDVAITKFSVPNSTQAGQTRSISVGVNSRLHTEQVQVVLYRSQPGPFGDFVEVGRLTQTTPVRSGNRTTSFPFAYTFTADDAAVGKVTFRATATILDERDALPADNEAISAPTKVGR